MVGIMTFHAAYNFGSSLQAYATQKAITNLGLQNEIINYRLNNQLHYYGDALTFKFGRKDFLRRCLCLREIKTRQKRAHRYEEFIIDKLHLSNATYHSYDELKRMEPEYSILVAGSDQVWNKHCTAEFKTEPNTSILSYYLDFENGKDVKRISFSSSLGLMNEDEVREYIPYLEKFQHIALREKDGADMIGRLLNKNISNTIDPTLLFSGDEWLREFKDELETIEKGYVLLYSLEKSPKKLRTIQHRVVEFSRGKTVICLSPFLSIRTRGVSMRNDAGPVQFLSFLANADCMITDSFHGTAFSVNLNVPFYTIDTGRDKRKQFLLRRVGLESQLINDIALLSGKDIPDINFNHANERLQSIRNESIDYLRHALIG